MAAGAPITITDQLNGKVGVAVGDGTWLTAAQFRAFPADPVALKALMVRLAYQDYSKVAPATMPPLDQVLLREALNLLGDPVSPQVRSAVYKVMAALPGVRSLGAMRDPLGRSGYGIDIGPGEGLTGLGSSVATEEIAFIDPGTGALLATEDRVTAPGRTIRANRPPGSMAGTWMCKQRPGWPTCNLPPYYGPLYQGQVWQYSAIQSQGWTDETPPAAGK
jgi:hypothetical protein